MTGKDPIPGASKVRFITTGSKVNAVSKQNALLKEYQKRNGKLPRFNQKKKG